MDSALLQLIQRIHDCPTMAAVVVTGAGTQALAWLFGVAGASRTMLDAQVPYSAKAFHEYIGRTPAKYVSGRSACRLAGNALRRARLLSEGAEKLVGLGCTATISTDYVKRGQHKAEVATWTASHITTYSLLLAKGERDRPGEEEVVSRLIIQALAEACGFDNPVDLNLLATDRLKVDHLSLANEIERVVNGQTPYIGLTAFGQVRTSGANPQVLLAGSFNPLHDGHVGLAAAAEGLLERPVAFELASVNVDKPPLPGGVILDRLAQFAGRYPIYVTRTPTFLDKIRLFSDTIFVVGFDTAGRVVDPRYYGGQIEQMGDALREIRRRGGRFLVAGRADEAGRFHEAADLDVPAEFADLFSMIPATQFRLDISSTTLRRTTS